MQLDGLDLAQEAIVKVQFLAFRKVASCNTFRFRLLEISYEGDFLSLCNVTFWQKVDFLISNGR